MNKIKTLTSAQVLSRMKRGDKLYLSGGYTLRAIFRDSDAALVSHKVIVNLIKVGKISYPRIPSIHSNFTLHTEDKQ